MVQPQLLPEEGLSEPLPEESAPLIEAVTLLSDPQVEERRRGLQMLLERDLHRRSVLAAASLGRAVGEPNISLRREIVVALAETLAGAVDSPPGVIEYQRHALGQMRRRQIYGLLQVAASSRGHAGLTHMVLEQCSYAGSTLILILKDRQMDIQIRVAAAQAIEAIGYLEAVPEVAVLENRLASRMAGQEDMGFVPSLEQEAELLLPALQALHRSLEEASR